MDLEWLMSQHHIDRGPEQLCDVTFQSVTPLQLYNALQFGRYATEPSSLYSACASTDLRLCASPASY